MSFETIFSVTSSPDIFLTGQILLAIFFGAILGMQREQWHRSAGVRTYALVTAGSALFTILSINSFGTDTARVAAQIVTGIGFLGAGAIMHKDDRVEGLTTAAGLWIAAAIGMAVGLGRLLLALNTTAIILIVLMIDDKKYLGKLEKVTKTAKKR